MFSNCYNFNQDISKWDVINVIDMSNIPINARILTKIYQIGMLVMLLI